MANDVEAERLKALARGHAEGAIAALAQVMGNPEEQGSARALAAKAILDRGFGAPERRTETKVDVTVVDQRAAHFAALQKLAMRNEQQANPATQGAALRSVTEQARIMGQPSTSQSPLIEDAEFEVVRR
jgi:hypothetical protein